MTDRSSLFAIFFSSCIHGVLALFFMIKSKEIPPKSVAPIEIVWDKKDLPRESSALQTCEIETLNHKPSYKQKKERVLPRPSKTIAYKNATVIARPQSDRSNDETGRTSQLQATGREKYSGVKSSSKLLTRRPHHPLPTYPWICRKRGQEGTVSVNVKSNGDGHVQEVTLHKSSGYAPLDKAALDALKSWIFAENFHQKTLSIIFRLKG